MNTFYLEKDDVKLYRVILSFKYVHLSLEFQCLPFKLKVEENDDDIIMEISELVKKKKADGNEVMMEYFDKMVKTREKKNEKEDENRINLEQPLN